MNKYVRRWIFAAIVIAFVGWLSMKIYYSNRIEELKSSHNAQVSVLQNKWREERRRKKAEYRVELEAAWGGGIKAVVKDPELGIRDMLRKAAIVACPRASFVEVRVDNFTEFDIYITVREALGKEDAASAVKTIVSECGKYVNSISFVYQNNVVKTIGKRAIDGVSNWSAVELSKISELLITP